MKGRRIGVLALQETHLTDTQVDLLHSIYGRRLQIFFTTDPGNVNSKGVAIVLNRDLTNVVGAISREIVPGRALLLTLPWHDTLTIRILAIYAPNNTRDNEQFWASLLDKWESEHLPKPDLMLGDFNIVEDAIDHLPCHLDAATATSALFDLRSYLQLQDGWRITNPDTKAFSFLQSATGSQSRIDRIYSSRAICDTAVDWTIDDSPVITDHRLVSLKVVDQKAPYVGRGRWTMPLFLLKDKEFLKTVHSMGKAMQTEVSNSISQRTSSVNPQTVFKKFKDDVAHAAKKRAREAVPKMEAKIRSLQTKLDLLLNENQHDGEAEKILAASVLQQTISNLERERFRKARTATSAHYRLEGETVSKYWMLVNKEKAPRDVIYSLRKLDSVPPIYESRSDRMAELARGYHEGLQTEDVSAEDPGRAVAIQDALASIESPASDQVAAQLADPVSVVHVLDALDSAAAGSAAGVNGLPYEFWKVLQAIFIKDTKEKCPTFDSTKVLAEVYSDIERYGVVEGTDFAAGWMCPIYKKKDKREVANYRPITLLNTDYKIFTKTLAMKLADAAPHLIHENQAGFIPGRSIFDQVKLSKLMIDYAEAVEENGVIIALDQEKAYDKIAHDYLWVTLRAFNIPDSFIKTVQSLYQHAETVVMINGETSTPFRVTRGVRQGDPMSCLLFDLAIEPLACMLRSSAIHGFQIPGVAERLIITLFADDTMAYLSEQDNFADLQVILLKWCQASRARFNVEKTEIIPIGSPGYRATVIATRRINPGSPPLPMSVHIVEEQEAIWSLGAWIGNGIVQAGPWAATLDEISDALSRWQKCSPTLRGKRFIVQMIVGGMSQYLARVQGMPRAIEDLLVKIIRNFVWDGANMPPVRYDTLCLPIGEGGIKLLDLPARNKAIDITWLRSYLDLSPSRPTWAFVADLLIGDSVTGSSGQVHKLSQLNLFLQSWSVDLHSKHALPSDLRSMLRSAQECNASFAAVKMTRSMKSKMPMWYHIGVKKRLKTLNNAETSKCLRERHGIMSVGDLVCLTKRERDNSMDHRHSPRGNCICQPCKTDREALGCLNPYKCCKAARRLLEQLEAKWSPSSSPPPDNLTLTTGRKEANTNARLTHEPTLFNPSLTLDGDLAQGFRIFTDPALDECSPAIRLGHGASLENERTIVYIQGCCTRSGAANASSGSGTWFGISDPRNTSLRVPTESCSPQAGDVASVLVAACKTPPFAPLQIVSASKYVVDGLTLHLPKWENRGWIGVANSQLFRAAAYHLRMRTAPTLLQWVEHSGALQGLTEASALAKSGAQKSAPDPLDLSIANRFNLTGARLASMTQALAHQGIREAKLVPPRRTTAGNLLLVQEAISQLTARTPTVASVWHAVRHRDVARNISDFLWKLLHGAHKCGAYWKNIPTLSERALCPVCGVEESMNHLLTACSAPGREAVWLLVQKLWQKKHHQWPRVTFGLIAGCALTDFRNDANLPLRGADRLFRILISESAFLIWKLRCERRIQRGDDPLRWHSAREIHNRWIHMVNCRLQLDQAMTSRRFERKALDKDLVLRTWSGTLENEDQLDPDDWTRTPEVLVSIGRLE